MAIHVQKINEKLLWAGLTLIMVLIALFFGLRPKDWYNANDVQLLPDKRSLRFHNTGIAYVDDLHAVLPDQPPDDFTIEIAATPGNLHRVGFKPLLVMHDGNDRRQLAIWQYGTSLIVMNGNDFDNSQRRPRIVAKNTFSSRQTRYFTITSDARGTHLFVDGSLIAANAKWKLSIPNKGRSLRLVLGNSVYGKHGWTGDLLGLAISKKALSAETVRSRFKRWTTDHDFDFMEQDSPLLLFTFNQTPGVRLADQSDNQHILKLPPQVIVLKKSILTPPWGNLYFSGDTLGDMLFNTIGFIPLGAVLYGFLQNLAGRLRRHPVLITIILCMALSLCIELLQAWIPTRVSSLMDLILNTVGAGLGIGLWQLMRVRNLFFSTPRGS